MELPANQRARWGPLAAVAAAAIALGACSSSDRPGVDTGGPDTVERADARRGDSAPGGDSAAPTGPSDAADADAAPADSGAGDTNTSTADTFTDGGGRDTDEVSTDSAGGDADADVCQAGEPCTLSRPRPCMTGVCDAWGACAPTPIPGCCGDDADCRTQPVADACQLRRCVRSVCTQLPIPGCCVRDQDCDDGVAATTEVCGQDTGRCETCAPSDACVGVAPLLSVSFDGRSLSLQGLSTTDTWRGDRVQWQRDDRRWVIGPEAAYLGDAECRTYYNGGLDSNCLPVDPFGQDARQVKASLTTRAFTLPSVGPDFVASFWVWSQTEPDLGRGPAEPDVLRVFVVVTADEVAWELTSTLAFGKSTEGWRPVSVGLAAFRGQHVRLRFAFDTFDGQANHFEGIYLDELQVAPSCSAGGCCVGADDCLTPRTPCHRAACVADARGAGRRCMDVPEQPNVACLVCEDAVACDDGDPCTVASCVDGRCEQTRFCCVVETVFTEPFDGGLSGWAIDDPDPDDGILWQAAPPGGAQGGLSLWFGAADRGTYDSGARAVGSVTSPLITLPLSQTGGLRLTFSLRLATEWDHAPYDNPTGVDRLVASVVTTRGAEVVWSSDAVDGSTQGSTIQVAVDLNPYAGEQVRLRFEFDSVDGERNAFAGPFVDAVEVRTTCD